MRFWSVAQVIYYFFVLWLAITAAVVAICYSPLTDAVIFLGKCFQLKNMDCAIFFVLLNFLFSVWNNVCSQPMYKLAASKCCETCCASDLECNFANSVLLWLAGNTNLLLCWRILAKAIHNTWEENCILIFCPLLFIVFLLSFLGLSFFLFLHFFLWGSFFLFHSCSTIVLVFWLLHLLLVDSLFFRFLVVSTVGWLATTFFLSWGAVSSNCRFDNLSVLNFIFLGWIKWLTPETCLPLWQCFHQHLEIIVTQVSWKPDLLLGKIFGLLGFTKCT